MSIYGNSPRALSTTWHIKRDYDNLREKEVRNTNWTYLRPDISKGITTLKLPLCIRLLCALIYDLTYQKGLRHKNHISNFTNQPHLSTTWHIKRDYDLIIYNKGVLQFLILSTTWHIKRDYDFLQLSLPSSKDSYLRPDISKGITTSKVSKRPYPVTTLSTTWHIKRDYDTTDALTLSVGATLIYDLTYQKGLRLGDLSGIFGFGHRLIYDLTYQKGLRRMNQVPCLNPLFTYLRPDISKGITTQNSKE